LLLIVIVCAWPLTLSVHAASQDVDVNDGTSSETIKEIMFANSLGMEFVYLPPGTFMMGSPPDESSRDDDEKQHRVTLTTGFYMQTTEVTQGQWHAVMGYNHSGFSYCGDDCPVENVSWHDVQSFIRKLNQREGSGTYRLPTEAEWEYAARAGSTTDFANGDISETGCAYDSNLDAMGWYCGNASKKTHPVARKQPNAWGLYDMHGNVYEWCRDWSGNYPLNSVTDPTGPSTGSRRVFRGGSWLSLAESCRSADRNGIEPGSLKNRLGFRLWRKASSDSKTVAITSAPEADYHSRYIASDNGVVYDTNTGLEWIAGPNKPTDWYAAESWAGKLTVAGGGWRLPAINELKTLYKKGAGQRNMTPLLKTPGWWIWSGETKLSSGAWFFNFGTGSEHWNVQANAMGLRCMAVRLRR